MQGASHAAVNLVVNVCVTGDCYCITHVSTYAYISIQMYIRSGTYPCRIQAGRWTPVTFSTRATRTNCTTHFTTGESGDYYYILDQGSADVFIKKDQGSEIKVNHYDAGGAFGELALLHGTYAFLLQYRQ